MGKSSFTVRSLRNTVYCWIIIYSLSSYLLLTYVVHPCIFGDPLRERWTLPLSSGHFCDPIKFHATPVCKREASSWTTTYIGSRQWAAVDWIFHPINFSPLAPVLPCSSATECGGSHCVSSRWCVQGYHRDLPTLKMTLIKLMYGKGEKKKKDVSSSKQHSARRRMTGNFSDYKMTCW